MEATVDVRFPRDLAKNLRLTDDGFGQEMQRLAVVKLYELGKLSSGRAAELLELSRIDFLELLVRYQISWFGQTDPEELRRDWAHA